MEGFSEAMPTLSLNLRRYLLKPTTRENVVKLSDMREFFADRDAVERVLSRRDPKIYEYREFTPGEGPGHLSVGITVIYPGKVGREYYMTRGHFHLKDTAEYYYCIAGRGILLLQSRSGEVACAELRAGTVAYIPPGWGHRAVNVGKRRLAFLYVYSSDSGHDYGVIKEKGFARIVVEERGRPRLVDNPRYARRPPRRKEGDK